MMTPRTPRSFVLAAFVLLPLAASQAATVVTEWEGDNHYTPDSAFPAFWTNNFTTTNNVLAGLFPSSATGNFSAEGATNLTAVTDGISEIATKNPPNSPDLSNFATAGNGDQLIFTLETPTQLTSIHYYGGWVDQGRSDIQFTVSYSTDNGATYTPLLDPTGGTFSVVGDPARQNVLMSEDSGGAPFYVPGRTASKAVGAAAFDLPVSNLVIINDDSGLLADGAVITDLKFDFFGGRNGYNGVMELAAFSAVPEPATVGLCALGAGFLVLTRARRRS